MIFTERPGHAAELARGHAPHYDAVFALGGDGTVMEVAGALAGTETPVGVLAGGTGNLLARALGIPLSMKRAVPSLLDGDQLLIDLGRFESGTALRDRRWRRDRRGDGRRDAGLAQAPAGRARVHAHGNARRGSVGGASGLLHRRESWSTARCSSDEAAAVMIANFGAVLGNRITLGPGIRTDDGLLDACVFSPRTLRDAFRIMARLLRGDFRSDPCMLYARGREVRVETTPPLPWQADGELMGSTPFSVVVEPLAVRLLVPREA